MPSNSNDSIPSFEYVPLEDVERIEYYRPGGYHPLMIGDILHNRYRIVHKLGYGTYSTIWLARDEKSQKYVAVKVCTANSNQREIDVLSSLARSPRLKHLGRVMIPVVQDRFELQGPHGSHPCYITSPARNSIAGAKDGSYIRLFRINTARALVAQLVLAVAYTHSQGFVHGDLHLGNVLLKLPATFHQLSIEQLYEEYGTPQREPIVRFDGKPLPPGVPSHGVLPIWLGQPSEDIAILDANILLTDFGEAFSPSKEKRHESHTPIAIAPPEVRFEPEKPLSFSSDIWTLACAIWTILGQQPLFEEFLATQEDITVSQVDILGKLPPDWWEKWETRCKWFDEAGNPNEGRYVWSWEERIEHCIQQPRREADMADFNQEERAAALAMLRQMLNFKPEQRLTVKEVLGCEWMVKWVLPEFEKARRAGCL